MRYIWQGELNREVSGHTGAAVFVVGVVLQDRASASQSQFDKGWRLRQYAVVVSAPLSSSHLGPNPGIETRSFIDKWQATTTASLSFPLLFPLALGPGLLIKTSCVLSAGAHARSLRTWLQVYGGVMVVYNCMCLIMLCAPGKRGVGCSARCSTVRLSMHANSSCQPNSGRSSHAYKPFQQQFSSQPCRTPWVA